MRAPTPPLRILLATDGSDYARRAAHWLAMLPVPEIIVKRKRG